MLPSWGWLAATLFLMMQPAHAGGPAFVAGASYFDPGVRGAPLVWANNTVTYCTDQGDLSPVLLPCARDPEWCVCSRFITTGGLRIPPVRVLGHILGLDASQANLNVWTGQPTPTAADIAGFPVMHAIDLPTVSLLPTVCQTRTNPLWMTGQPSAGSIP